MKPTSFRKLAGLGLAFWLTTSLTGAATTDIAGNFSLPRWDWKVFGPVDQNAPLVEPALLKTIPTELTIAGKALKLKPVNVEDKFCRHNLGALLGGTEIGKTAYVFIPFSVPAETDATFGFGADWWLQAWVDGKLIMDTTADGNKTWPPTIQDFQATVHVSKGAHVLAVRFISGSGSSILAVGGPNDLRLGPPPYPLSLFQNTPMPAGNLIANGGFEDGPEADPFVPVGWVNGKGRCGFRKTEVTAQAKAPIFGKRSLEINTLTSGAVKRKLAVPFSADVDTCYEIRFKACHLAGDGYASISVRNDLDGRCDTGFIRAIGWNNTYDRYNQAIKKGQLGAGKAYYLFDTPNPSLVLETHGPVHAVLDDICIVPVDRSKMWDTWCEQRGPEKSAWSALSKAVVTPHTAWAKPYAGGTLKVISLMPRKRQRLTIELAQRLSMEYTPVFFEWDKLPNGPYVLGYDYWVYDADGDPQLFIKEADTLARLTQPADCIVIADLHASSMTPRLTETILQRVAAGAGLVIMASPYIVKDLPAFTAGPWAAALNEKNRTTTDIDWIKLNAASVFQDAKQPPAFYEFGRGRIVLWSTHTGSDRMSLEANLPAMLKAMLWSARKLPEIRLGAIALPGKSNGILSTQVQRAAPGRIEVALISAQALPKDVMVTGWVDDFGNEPPISLGRLAPLGDSSAVVFELPPLPTGKHCLHFQVTQGTRVEDWSTVMVDVMAPAGIKAIEFDRKNRLYTTGDLVTGRVALDVPLKPDQRLHLQLRDADGRLWATNEFTSGKAEFVFSLPTAPLVTLRHRLHAAIMDASGCVAAQETEFSVVRPPAWYATFFDFQLWCIPNDNFPATCELRKLGVTSDFHGFLCRNHALSNIRGGPGVGLHWEAENKPGVYFPNHLTAIVGDKEHAPIRYPCLNDPEYQAQMTKHIAEDIANGTQYAPQAYSLAHEWNYRSYGSLTGPVDICFCPRCLASFRQFVQAEHGTLDRLNAVWGSTFANWDAVTPLVLADAVKAQQIPRWIDHRRHADKVFTDFFKLKLSALRKVDPGAEGGAVNLRVGLTTLDSYSGVDFWQLYHDADVFSYLENPYIRDFTPRDSARRRLIGHAGAMWYPDRFTGSESLFRLRLGNQPWKALLEGAHGFMYYEEYFFMPPQTPFKPILNADLTTSENIRTLAAAVTQIRGLSRFLFEGRRSDSGIALLYSRSSEHAATAWQALQTDKLAEKISPPGQMGFYTEALNALGYQFAAVADDQVADGVLTTGGYRLLILPVAQALSSKAVEQIRAFVRGGGCVVADLRPAMGDLHGCLGTTGALDDVFGVRHQTAYSAYAPVEDNLRISGQVGTTPLDWQAPGAFCGPALELAGASPQGRGEHSNRPVLLVNPFGQGHAVLLNFVLPKMDENALPMMSRLLSGLGLHPLFGMVTPNRVPSRPAVVTATDPTTPADAEGFTAGRSSVVRPYLTDMVNGRIHCFGFWSPVRRGIGSERLVITPPVTGYIYDLKTNHCLGRQSQFTVTLPLEDTAFFASVPYRIRRPDLTLAPAESKNGLAVIRCLAKLNPAEAAQDNLVIHFRLFAPDGTEWPDFAAARTAKAGAAEHEFVLPLDAPRGRWRVEAREAISGLTGIEHITL